MTKQQLIQAMGCGEGLADKWYWDLAQAMERFGICGVAREAAFVAQVGHESGSLTVGEENLNYKAERLLKVFPSRFKTLEQAQEYAGQPEKLASYIYGGRNGNGDQASGDGWRYRGRGPIQLTGKANYHACGLGIGQDLVQDPDKLLQPSAGSLSAAWFWDSKGLGALADLGTDEAFKAMTKRINGGYNGHEDRLARWARAKAALGQS